LPRQSPATAFVRLKDFSPIENFWNEIKIYLRKQRIKLEENLEGALNFAIASVTAKNILSYFNHTGYVLI
jgi:hypothetical protein